MEAMPPTGKSETKPYAVYDVGASVKTGGRRGLAWGGAAGFALGVAFIAIPFSSQVLSFGILGTLIVATVEGAVIAGAIGAFAALVYGKGVLQCEGVGFDPGCTGRRPTNAGNPTALIPTPDWPAHRQNPKRGVAQFQSETARAERAGRQMLEEVRRSLNAIDTWNSCNTAPWRPDLNIKSLLGKML